jgi:hypothetical protein
MLHLFSPHLLERRHDTLLEQQLRDSQLRNHPNNSNLKTSFV